MDIAETLKSAYADMDPKTGMFPADWSCKACGVQLNADGGHPAELYAGTFTGLCYRCERSGPYVVPGSELPDGARLMSWPPSCPSWRRNRTEHWSYPDCPECKGQGARMRYGHMNQWTEYCRACSARVMVRRKTNEAKLLRTVAGALEMVPLREVAPEGERTPAMASVAEAIRRVRVMAERMFSNEPAAWKPHRTIYSYAEGRLTPGQWRVKRADTLRRHVVSALREEADARELSAG
jgi:hypothetical protein